MHEERHNPEVSHEQSDIRPVAVTVTGIAILFGTIAVVFLLWFLFDFLLSRERLPVPRAGIAPIFQTIREPLLQRSPPLDMEQMRAKENLVLNNYTWVDRGKGVVSIPVERAIEILAQKGLPPAGRSVELKLFPPSAGHRQSGFDERVIFPGER